MASTWSNRLFKKVTLKKCTNLTSKEINVNANNNKQTIILEAETRRKQIYEIEGKIMELQKIISENEITMNDTDNMIRQEELSIENLSEEMEEKMEMLESVKQDHKNYKNVDHMMAVRKMYEDLKRDAVDHTTIKKEYGKRNYKLFYITLNNSSHYLDDSSVEEKSMASYEDTSGFDNDTDETPATLHIDYDTISLHDNNSNINMNNTYANASRSIHRIADKLKKKVTLE